MINVGDTVKYESAPTLWEEGKVFLIFQANGSIFYVIEKQLYELFHSNIFVCRTASQLRTVK